MRLSGGVALVLLIFFLAEKALPISATTFRPTNGTTRPTVLYSRQYRTTRPWTGNSTRATTETSVPQPGVAPTTMPPSGSHNGAGIIHSNVLATAVVCLLVNTLKIMR